MGSPSDTMPTRRNRRAQQDQDLEELHRTILTASSTPRPTQVEESTSVGMAELIEALKGIAGQGSRGTFKPPQYSGEGDIELFISQNEDVAKANGWSSQESTLHLRSSLTGKALECGRGEDTEEIFTELRAHFGMTARQAKEQLHRFQRSPRQSIRDMGTQISSLVKKAYGKLDQEDQEEMALDIFVKALGDRDLKRMLLIRPPGDMKEAIQLSEDFLQTGECKSSKVTALVEVENEPEGKQEEKKTPEITAVLAETLATMKHVLELQSATLSALCQSKQQPPQEKKILACYHCGGSHLKRNCPQLRNTNTTQQSGKGQGPAQSGAQLSLDQKHQ